MNQFILKTTSGSPMAYYSTAEEAKVAVSFTIPAGSSVVWTSASGKLTCWVDQRAAHVVERIAP